MADIIDQAQASESLEREAAISAACASLDGPGPHWIGDTPFCRECGESIPRARVKAVPGSPHCVDCAEELQRDCG